MYVYIWGFAIVDDFYPERSLGYLSPDPPFTLDFSTCTHGCECECENIFYELMEENSYTAISVL